MQRPDKKKEPATLANIIEETTYMPGSYKAPCCPPAIDAMLQLKWGLYLLGKDRAKEYLTWMERRLHHPL